MKFTDVPAALASIKPRSAEEKIGLLLAVILFEIAMDGKERDQEKRGS